MVVFLGGLIMDNEYSKVIEYYVLKSANIIFDYNDENYCMYNVFNQYFRTLDEATNAIVPFFENNLENIIKKATDGRLFIPSSYHNNKTEYLSYDKFGNKKEKPDNEKRLDLSRLKLHVYDIVDNYKNPAKSIIISCPTQQRYYEKIRFYDKVLINGKEYERVDFKVEETEWEDHYKIHKDLANNCNFLVEAEVLSYEFQIVKQGQCINYYKPGDKLTI